jgi:putative transposase
MFFFTLTLNDRRSSALVDHVALLRAAFHKTRGERPFPIDAIVILPDHLHAIMTLPSGDSDFSGRWRRQACRSHAMIEANTPFGKGAFGSTPFATAWILSAALTTFISTPSSIDW